MRSAREDVVSRERQYGVSIHASTDTLRITSQSGREADVSAHIVLTAVIEGSSQRAVEQWTFHLHDDGGWRVCDGHEIN
jgi:hypothetical protein